MFQPLYIAATGLNAFEDQMVDITNNLANARTTAFKRGETQMESLFYLEKTFQARLTDEMEKPADKAYAPIEFGTGVRVAATPKDFTQGNIEITNNSTDMAIQGEGFFQFRMPDGSVAFGRAGNLHVDNAGNLVDPNGRMFDPNIVIPDRTTSFTVREDGTVFVTVDNELEQLEIGQINLARFTNPGGLQSIGQNLFKATESSGDPIIGIPNEDGFGYVQQYALEGSNVDVIQEMMRMIMVQRVFDTVSKAVQAYDGMLQSLDRIKQ